ncbi:MAG: hypothetical protein H8E41_05720 [Desulfobulbaceae bacterium]|uniref:Uncharacterized protein n=1 Tax=Candidatus Desulfobia pelagia TaxID=2841692 RepID=A0A8J6NCK5_9BACT|nr:hypothetical protein [Candidatus Desulfobia pelagia]
MNKNNIIAALVVLCLIGSVWGTVMSRKSDSLDKKLTLATNELEALQQERLALSENLEFKDKNVREMRNKLQDATTGSDQLKAHLTTSTEEMFRLQSSLEEGSKRQSELKNTLTISQKELQEARESVKLLQQKIESVETSSLEKIENLQLTIESRNNELSAVNHKLAGMTATVEALQTELASRTVDLGVFKEQKNIIAARETSLQKTQKELAVELEQAQVKIIEQEEALEEKTREFNQAAKELRQLQVNMDVLLTEISKQKGVLEKMTREREASMKTAANKDKLIEDLRRQLEGQVKEPAQQ